MKYPLRMIMLISLVIALFSASAFMICMKTTAYKQTSEDFLPTESRLVTIEDFHATKLDNNRDLYVYLPPSYYISSTYYPVLYVQDGKGVFFESDWSKESLSMNQTADSLIQEGIIPEIVIVGIANTGSERASEYAHWDGHDNGSKVIGKGELYEDFILNDVIPYINRTYRVKTDRDNTGIMGASLGGLVSFNIGMRNPEIFSMIALQSPYLGWGNNEILQHIANRNYAALKTSSHMKLWMDVSATENELYRQQNETILQLKAVGFEKYSTLATLTAENGTHSESAWAKRVPDALKFLFSENQTD